MEVRRELLLTVSGLALINLVLAFGAIALFVRMGPAIERILEENVVSIMAAEDVMVELAIAPGPLDPGAEGRIREALRKARDNITEQGERSVLESAGRELEGSISGDQVARGRLVMSMRELITINRAAMQDVDDEARRLGSSGAWSGVFLGFLSFLLSLLIVIRFQRRFVRPLEDLSAVLESVHRGDRLRRCPNRDAPHEIVRVVNSVNRLLDERLRP